MKLTAAWEPSRRFFLGVALLLGVLACSAGMAWACTPSANISVGPKSGEAGTAAVVNGDDFGSDAPINIRWNSTSGPLLATTTGPTFSVPVKIPQAAPGVYYVVAIEERGGKAAAPFEVTDAPRANRERQPQENVGDRQADLGDVGNNDTGSSPLADDSMGPLTIPQHTEGGAPMEEDPVEGSQPEKAPPPRPASLDQPPESRAEMAPIEVGVIEGPQETGSRSQRSSTADLWAGFARRSLSLGTPSPLGEQAISPSAAWGWGLALASIGTMVFTTGFIGADLIRRRRATEGS